MHQVIDRQGGAIIVKTYLESGLLGVPARYYNAVVLDAACSDHANGGRLVATFLAP
jgi:hypothetical protein